MKRNWILMGLLVVCLCLSACTANTPAASGESGAAAATNPTDTTVPTVTRGPLDLGKTVAYELAGSCAVTYTVNISAVRYIVSAENLPELEELQGYDAAWFQEHALLLIYETVRNTAMEVGIKSIVLEEGCANVTLSHEPGENPGTTMMTTRLLWAEVEAGLDCEWCILNPAEESSVSDY